MPAYDYKCMACSTVTTQLRGFDDPALDKCACGFPVRRVFSATPAVFRGAGFYKTDTRYA